MKKNLPWILVGILALVSVFIMLPKNETSVVGPATNVVVRDGVQYVTINARGGYRPYAGVDAATGDPDPDSVEDRNHHGGRGAASSPRPTWQDARGGGRENPGTLCKDPEPRADCSRAEPAKH